MSIRFVIFRVILNGKRPESLLPEEGGREEEEEEINICHEIQFTNLNSL
jgi:hypothetical protein